MVNRCQVRTLLRTVGYVAGLSLGVTAAMAGDPKPSDGRNQHMLATPFWADGINPNQVQVVPGGDGEFEPQGGQRTDFCTAGGDANGYDRPIGMTVYPTVILGQFNLEEFYCADDFTPTNSGNVNQVCWTGYFSTNVCDGDDTTAPDQWNVNFYNFDPGTGLPGTIIASFANHGGTPNMVVAQGPTGLPVGINPSLTEHVFSAALGSNVAVSAGTCYYVELFFNTNRPCFYNQSLSYEPSTETTAEGNRSFLRRNNRLFPAYQSLDFINLDMTIKIGFTAANTLAPSNAFLRASSAARPPTTTSAARQRVSPAARRPASTTRTTHTSRPRSTHTPAASRSLTPSTRPLATSGSGSTRAPTPPRPSASAERTPSAASPAATRWCRSSA